MIDEARTIVGLLPVDLAHSPFPDGFDDFVETKTGAGLKVHVGTIMGGAPWAIALGRNPTHAACFSLLRSSAPLP